MTLSIFDIKHFAVHDGPGIRTTIFLKGCPLHCAWCHNPESISAQAETYTVKRHLDGKTFEMEKIYGEEKTIEELMVEVMKDKVFYEESGGGVTLSGGEPMMQHSGIKKLLIRLKEEGLHVAIDTAGYVEEEHFRSVMPMVDLFLYDLKLMDTASHKKYTGQDNHLILSNADILLKEGKSVIFRIPVIPGINDGEQERVAMLDYLEKRKHLLKEVHLLSYHEIGADKYRRMDKDYTLEGLKAPSAASVESFKNEISARGIDVSIGG